MKIKLIFLLLISALILQACKYQISNSPQINSQSFEINEPERISAHVTKVIDGDTIIVDTEYETDMKVRLIGINTPESVAPEEYLKKTGKENTEEGKNASEFTRELLEDHNVYLEYDTEKEDKYGRTLAYVYTENGQMVQDILLENHIAEIMTIQPNTKYEKHFEKILEDNP